jgi:hypothetical protein
LKLKNKGMILEFFTIAMFLAITGGLTYTWGFSSYVVSGEVTDLQITKDGRYIVIIDGDREIVIHMTLFMRSQYGTPKALFDTLAVGRSYDFLCWGDTPRIYGVA